MKNIEIVNALNNLNAFVERQRAQGTTLLSVGGQFAIKANEKALMEEYKPYEATLNEIKEKYNLEDKDEMEKANAELKELMEIDVEVSLRKVHEEDFKDGATIDDIILLDFMTE